MILGFKTELKLNNKQRTQLLKHAGVARHAFNWGNGLIKQILDHNRASPESKIKFPSAIDLHKWLVELVKTENPWYYESSKSAPQEALRALRTAWDRCFKKVSGAPRFKKKGKHDSFTLSGSGLRIAGSNLIRVPVIGILKTYEKLPRHLCGGIIPQKSDGVSNPHRALTQNAAQVQPKSVAISRTADRWFISWRIETESISTSKSVEVVGVDLGIKALATLSTGKVFEQVLSYSEMASKLSRLQWLNRHKQKGSANWKKAQVKIARLYQRIAFVRKDTLHKLTTYLAKNHSTIVIENLNVSGMMANHKLASSVQNMGFYEFRRQLEYKTKLYGSELVIISRWFPSSKTCSSCGVKKETLSLSERVFTCDVCKFSLDRDLNASVNLKNAASHAVSVCGSVEADFSELKQENFSL